MKSSSSLSVHLLRADAVERQAQQVAQPRQHGVGGVDVAVHQRRDRVQRVEEEMRVQLPLQRLQPRLGEPGLQLRRRERALLRLAVVVERVAHADDGPVGHHLPVEVEEEPLADAEPPVHLAAGQQLQRGDAAGAEQHRVREGEDDDRRHVHGQRAGPLEAFEPVACGPATA